MTVVKKVNKPHTNNQTISTNTVNITVVKTNKGSNIHQQSIRLYIVNIEKETTLTHTHTVGMAVININKSNNIHKNSQCGCNQTVFTNSLVNIYVIWLQ